ncbi:hypothetical protein H1C71_016231 [Ictidomys tridecemlineatus]|nr:hypothetical protein H1C71_016231 [Ictidomys tridecemlineatus]
MNELRGIRKQENSGSYQGDREPRCEPRDLKYSNCHLTCDIRHSGHVTKDCGHLSMVLSRNSSSPHPTEAHFAAGRCLRVSTTPLPLLLESATCVFLICHQLDSSELFE